MEDLKLIISLISTCFGAFITAMTFMLKMIKNAKAKKIAEQTIKISGAILPFINEAEKFVSFSGEEKKAYVMTKANQFAIENNIAFNMSEISTKIEELVSLTKQVNNKSKVLLDTNTQTNEAENKPAEPTINNQWL